MHFLCRLFRLSSRIRHQDSPRRNFTEAFSNQETHFGFDSIPENEKEEKVHEVFKNVANSYDTMNDAMSFGIHRLWKDYFMMQLAPTPDTKLLDVAGGTGDIAFRFLKYVDYAKTDSPEEDEMDLTADLIDGREANMVNHDPAKQKAHVTVCDINQSMLDVGQKRASELGYDSESISWIQGNAESLSFPDNYFDAYTIAFGIRNVTHIDKALSEAYRVLRPGGRFMCLEFSHVPNPLLRSVYDQYSFQVIPVMGKVVAGDWKSYQYLVESIRRFPKQEDFARMIRTAGFRMVSHENINFGITAIHSAFKL